VGPEASGLSMVLLEEETLLRDLLIQANPFAFVFT
jgi:hypothetical protein